MKKPGLAARVAILPIRFYQKFISPVIHILPGSGCRYHPTCSEYAVQAVKKHGAIKGVLMGFFRIVRCNPFGGHGIDEVPEKFTFGCLFRQNHSYIKKDVDEEVLKNHKD
jgi:putative membrane protein insertion efficiency factor